MPVAAWFGLVWGVCTPLSLAYCLRTGFLERSQVLGFRLVQAVWVAPVVAIVAVGSAVGAVIARALHAERAAAALAWWRS